MDSVSQMSLEVLAGSSPNQYFSVAFLAALINFNTFFFFNTKLHRFSGVYDSKDTLPLECMDQSRQ